MDLHAENVSLEIYRNMSPAQKWREMVSLREFAWKVKRAGVRTQHPEWSEEKVDKAVKEIFLNAAG